MNLFDTTDAPKKNPKSFVRGDYIAWRNFDLVADYPTAEYSLRYNFRSEGEPAREFIVDSTVDSGEYLFEMTGSVTALIDAGRWHWDLYVIRLSDSERVTVDQGEIRVLANKAEDSTDPRSLPNKMVAEIERAMLHRASNNQLDTLAYSLGVETSATRNPAVLRDWYNFWRAEQLKANRKWRARNGKRHSGVIRVRF